MRYNAAPYIVHIEDRPIDRAKPKGRRLSLSKKSFLNFGMRSGRERPQREGQSESWRRERERYPGIPLFPRVWPTFAASWIYPERAHAYYAVATPLCGHDDSPRGRDLLRMNGSRPTPLSLPQYILFCPILFLVFRCFERSREGESRSDTSALRFATQTRRRVYTVKHQRVLQEKLFPSPIPFAAADLYTARTQTELFSQFVRLHPPL